MSTKYILINISYDENESEKSEFSDIEGLKEEFEGDEELLDTLLSEGSYEWEWGDYYLIKLEDYK
jgi:hypothetical protein